MKLKMPELKKMETKTRSFIAAVGLKLENVVNGLGAHLRLQEHWLKRVNAVAVDYFILLVATGIMWPTAHFLEFMLTAGMLTLFYFTVMESFFGYTIGKRIFSLKVVNINEKKPTLKTSFKRNLSKFNIGLLLIDTIMGFRSNSRQKYFDKLENTNVVDTSIITNIEVPELIYCDAQN